MLTAPHSYHGVGRVAPSLVLWGQCSWLTVLRYPFPWDASGLLLHGGINDWVRGDSSYFRDAAHGSVCVHGSRLNNPSELNGDHGLANQKAQIERRACLIQNRLNAFCDEEFRTGCSYHSTNHELPSKDRNRQTGLAIVEWIPGGAQSFYSQGCDLRHFPSHASLEWGYSQCVLISGPWIR